VRDVPALNRGGPRSAARIATALAAADPVLARVIEAAGPYRLVPERDRSPYEHLTRAIAHQQLNGTAAATILRRFVALYGDGRFPEPQQVLSTPAEALRGCGFSMSKIAALHDLAARAIDGLVPDCDALDALDDAGIVARLTQVRGVGRWTVQMMLMFQLGRADVLPVDDFGVRNGFRLAYGLRALPSPAALAGFGARWAPHRTAAAWYLWRAVDLARANRLPAPLRPAPRLRRAAAARGRR
jgi:DNA-3-methyladenine glycosylase II